MSETFILLGKGIPSIVQRNYSLPGTRLTASEAREYASRLLALADELSPADPPAPAKDALQTARDAYEAAKRRLDRDTSSVFAIVTSPYLLEHAGEVLDAGIPYITALEAHAAAQQQRIDELTAALEPFAQRFEWDNMDIAGDDSDPMYQFVMNTDDLLPGTPVIERREFRRAHEALRGKGAE